MVDDHEQTGSPEPKSNAKLMLGLTAAMSFLFGLIMLLIGFQESSVRAATADPPKQVTLTELDRDGAGENRFVELTEFTFSDEMVIEEATGGTWTRAYVPLYRPGAPSKPVAIAELKGGGERGIKGTMQKGSLLGLVSADREKFGATIGKLMRDKHPDMKADDTYFMIDQVPGQSEKGGLPIAFITAGLLITVGGVLTFTAMRR